MAGKITKGEQTKNRIIECAAELFFRNGYNSTGINDILKITKLPKGSFYFHFESKKELAIEVNAYFQKKLGKWISDTAKNKQWEEFVNNLVNDMINGVESGVYFGCPLITLGQELAFFEPEIASYYHDSLKKLIDLFTYILENSGIPKENAARLARRVFAIYEGNLVYYRISKNKDVLRNMGEDLIIIYKNYLETGN